LVVYSYARRYAADGFHSHRISRTCHLVAQTNDSSARHIKNFGTRLRRLEINN
jgi:hypothetical protein